MRVISECFEVVHLDKALYKFPLLILHYWRVPELSFCYWLNICDYTEGCCCVWQLLRIVRENTVVIVVGETGSGKTTQLTQVCRQWMVLFHCITIVIGNVVFNILATSWCRAVIYSRFSVAISSYAINIFMHFLNVFWNFSVDLTLQHLRIPLQSALWVAVKCRCGR